MDAHLVGPGRDDSFSATNMSEICEILHAAVTGTLRQRQIRFACDVPRQLQFAIPRERVERILTCWIQDAIDHMSPGGELDLIVVETVHGLEIEVSDSRDDNHVADESLLPNSLRSDEFFKNAEGADVLKATAVRCPQGGVARILKIPRQDGLGTNSPPIRWRRVA